MPTKCAIRSLPKEDDELRVVDKAGRRGHLARQQPRARRELALSAQLQLCPRGEVEQKLGEQRLRQRRAELRCESRRDSAKRGVLGDLELHGAEALLDARDTAAEGTHPHTLIAVRLPQLLGCELEKRPVGDALVAPWRKVDDQPQRPLRGKHLVVLGQVEL